MPGPLLAAGIMAGAGLLGQGANAIAQGNMNKKNRKWQEQMYGRQRADALSDWYMEAQYNSPGAQMQRLKAAGLNPNLVYGTGTDATMGSVRSSTSGTPSTQAPSVDTSFVGDSLGAFYDMKMKDAQMSNLSMARDVAAQELLLKAAQTQKTLQDTHSSEFDLKMKNELKDINVEMAQRSLEKNRAEADKAWNEANITEESKEAIISKASSEARKALNEANASNHLEKRVIQELQNLKKDGDIKKFQIDLQKLGLQPNDKVYLRIMATLFGADRVKKQYDRFGKMLD